MKCAKCKDSGLTYEEVMGIMTVKQIYCDCEQGVKKETFGQFNGKSI